MMASLAALQQIKIGQSARPHGPDGRRGEGEQLKHIEPKWARIEWMAGTG